MEKSFQSTHHPSLPHGASVDVGSLWLFVCCMCRHVSMCVVLCVKSVCLCVRQCACAGVSVLSMCTFVGMHVACVLCVFWWMFIFLLHISTCVFSSNRNVLCMSSYLDFVCLFVTLSWVCTLQVDCCSFWGLHKMTISKLFSLSFHFQGPHLCCLRISESCKPFAKNFEVKY